MVSRIVIGNIISLITFGISIVANSIINRRKHLKLWVLINSIDCITWALLGSWQGSLACLYPAIRHSYILWKYKEEKIIISFKDSVITSLPYLVIGLIELKNGFGWLVFAGIINFSNSMSFMIRKDEHKQLFEGSLDIYYLLYGLYYRNYGETLRNVVEMTIFGINVIRLKLNGENKYYKDKTNVI